MHNQFKTQKFKHLMLAMGPRDLNSAPYSPVHCSSHSMTSFQSSELTELPVVENSQLFAQRVHSARTVRPLWSRWFHWCNVHFPENLMVSSRRPPSVRHREGRPPRAHEEAGVYTRCNCEHHFHVRSDMSDGRTNGVTERPPA